MCTITLLIYFFSNVLVKLLPGYLILSKASYVINNFLNLSILHTIL